MRLILILLLPTISLLGCTSPKFKQEKPKIGLSKEHPSLAGTYLPKRDVDIGIPEQIKAYPIGRYVDPSDPNALHERHTIYRREQTGHWNLAAASGVAASRSHYLTADKAQQTEQQRAYYEAAQEQTRVAQEKLLAAEQKVATLEKENASLKEKTRPSRIFDPIQKTHEIHEN